MSQFRFNKVGKREDWLLPALLIGAALAAVIVKPAYGAQSQASRQSTFVGNGGNAQDLELASALAVVSSTAAGIEESSEGLCGCPDQWSQNDLCRVLRDLSAPEKKLCREALITHADELAKLSSRDSDVNFVWSERPISAKEGTAPERSVDAVTQPDKRTVIINRERFYQLPISFRVALLTHELMHMVKHDGHLINDEASAPPFKNGSAFLDVMGAAVAVEANQKGTVQAGVKVMAVSKSRKNHWVSMNFGTIDHDSKSSKALLKTKQSGLSSLDYTYRPDQIGLQLAIEGQEYKNRYTSDINVNEALTIYCLGVDYKINPINRYLSRWNELYVTALASIGSGNARYQISDGDVSLSDSGPATAVKAGVRVYLPITNGFWVIGGYDLRRVNYNYKTLKIKTIEYQNILSLGGVYGF